MPENTKIYNFGEYSTASEEVAEIFFYLKKMGPELAFSENDSAAVLVEKQEAVSGYVSRIKSSLKQFMKNAYKADLTDAPEGSYAARISAVLDEMKKITFYFREAAVDLPPERLRENLHRAAELSAGLDKMAAALDAGEDEMKERHG